MEAHAKSPVCNSCHRFIDPIGLALDNYDVVGQWRIRENMASLDTRGVFYDGTPISTPAELAKVLSTKRVSMVRAFTGNLMAYAVGRRVEYYDMPAIRKIVSDAEKDGYRMQDFITGVVLSDAFRMKAVPKISSANGQ
jgi:hypothetical protein